jgi:hypothetical protein
MTANRAASIRARLKQHADASKQDFNLILTRYGLERLLYRSPPPALKYARTPAMAACASICVQRWLARALRCKSTSVSVMR